MDRRGGGRLWRSGPQTGAEQAFGAATLATAGLTAGAMMTNGGVGRALDIAEPTLDVSRGGLRDLKGERSVAQVGQPMSDSLLVLVQQERNVVQRRTGLAQPSRRNTAAVQAYDSPARTVPTAETWARQWYRAQESGRNRERVGTEGYALLGEELHRRAEPVMRRHRQSETTAVVHTTRFRRETARAQNGFGESAPGRTIPRALGLDAAAGGAHVAEMNRFVRLSDRVGLSRVQREQLLTEARRGEISPQLRQKIEDRVQQSGTAIKPETLITAARAMPDTLSGPRRVRFGHQPAEADIAERKRALRRVEAAPPAVAGKAEISPELLSVSTADAGAEKSAAANALRADVPVAPSFGQKLPEQKQTRLADTPRTSAPHQTPADITPSGDGQTNIPRGAVADVPVTPPSGRQVVENKPSVLADNLREAAKTPPSADEPPATPRGRAVFSVDAPPEATKKRGDTAPENKSGLAAALADPENDPPVPPDDEEQSNEA